MAAACPLPPMDMPSATAHQGESCGPRTRTTPLMGPHRTIPPDPVRPPTIGPPVTSPGSTPEADWRSQNPVPGLREKRAVSI